MFERGLPVPRVYFSVQGERLFVIKSENTPLHFGCILSWIDGDNFQEISVTSGEARALSKSLAQINENRNFSAL